MEEDRQEQLVELFAPQPDAELAPDVMGELQSMLRLHSIAPQELFYKWESYSLKMGADETRLDLNTARAFKTDLFESLERENRSKVHTRPGTDKRTAAGATPRNAVKNSGDVFGMYVSTGCLFNLHARASLSPILGSTGLCRIHPAVEAQTASRGPL